MSSLAEPIVDDLEGIGYNPETHERPKAFTPPARGKYALRITGWREQTDFNTKALKNPYELSVDFAIANGPYENRTAKFQKVSSRQFKSRKSSLLTDLLAAVAKATGHQGEVKGRDAIKALLDLARDTNAVIDGRTDWYAEDKQFIRGIFDNGETPTGDQWNESRIEGQSKFNAEGVVVGPSGNELTANLKVTGFVVPA